MSTHTIEMTIDLLDTEIEIIRILATFPPDMYVMSDKVEFSAARALWRYQLVEGQRDASREICWRLTSTGRKLAQELGGD